MAIIKHGNNALANVTAFPSAIPTGKPVLLSTATASSSSSIEFTSGIDSTYDIYQFEFVNIHPATDGATLEIQGSTNGGSSYGIAKTTTYFTTFHDEADSSTGLTYYTGEDLAQSTSSQNITHFQGNDNDQSASGNIYIFSPSSSNFVKHFLTEHNEATQHDNTVSNHVAGYFNTTSAINAIKFFMSSGNIDAGTIKMYGISA